MSPPDSPNINTPLDPPNTILPTRVITTRQTPTTPFRSRFTLDFTASGDVLSPFVAATPESVAAAASRGTFGSASNSPLQDPTMHLPAAAAAAAAAAPATAGVAEEGNQIQVPFAALL